VGFKAKHKTYKLIFEDEEFEGLEVLARSLPLGSFMDTIGAMPTPAEALDPSRLTAEQRGAVGDMFAEFARALVSWNLEDDDGEPVPATLDGLQAQDIDFVMRIITAWMDALGGIPAPLAGRSTAGVPSLAGSIPMEPLSASRAS
jgi:hypothetical protein